MRKINIVHLSDLHISLNNLEDIRIILDALIKDLLDFEQKGKKVDLICFTGDLINRGDKSEEQLNLALDVFITPLLEALKLPSNRFLLIPGNHDIDRSKIDKFSENGLKSGLKSRKEINEFLDRIEDNKHHFQRTKHIKEFIDLLIESKDWSDPLTYTKILNINDIKVGIAGFDSAWRCSGKDDFRHLIVGEREVDKALKSIEGSDLKVALIHHPLNWLVEDDERAVSALLNQFNIVLNGHVHDLGENQLNTRAQSTIYSICGALFSGDRSTYNGYNFIEFEMLTGNVRINLREFFDTPRRSFDAAITKCPEGFVEYKFDTQDSSIGQAIEIINNIRNNFKADISQQLISNLVDKDAPKSFDNLFILPNLNKESDYIKGSSKRTEKDTKINLIEQLGKEGNILFIGREDVGKTTLLHYIASYYLQNYTQYFKVPFYIDFNNLPAGHNPIEKLMIQFAMEYFEGTNTPSMGTIIELLNKNRCVLLIDNLNLSNKKHFERLNKFIENNPDNKFIFTAKEDIFVTISKVLPDMACKYTEVYISTLSKSDIRELINKWFYGRDVDVEQLLNRVMYYFNNVGMPRTPFFVSLILATCSHYENFIPINEANVMENFMEIVFEKLSLENTKSSTYDFHSKEKFLSHLAWELGEGKKKWFELTEFYRITLDYHEYKGLNLEKSKFNEIFFDKGILVKKDNKVYFRYKSFQEYYLAKAAVNNRDVLEWMLDEDNYKDHLNEMNFYTGIEREELSIMTFIQEKLYEQITPLTQKLQLLENYGLDSSILPTLDEFKKEGILTETQRDEITNLPDNYNENNPDDINEKQDQEDKTNFLNLLVIYGKIIRNSEDISLEEKMKHLKYCIKAYIALLAVFKEAIEISFKENRDEFSDLTEDDVSKIKSIIKYIAPFVLQNIAYESIGTGKLETTLIKLIEIEKNDFIRFMLVFIYSDLKLENYIIAIKSLISSVENKDVLLLIKSKLLIYYKLNQVKNNEELLSMIADIEIKVNDSNSFNKSRMMKNLKRQLETGLVKSI